MKNLWFLRGSILSMVLLACMNMLWSCSEDEEEVLPPAIELTTQGVEMKALGGNATVMVNVANAVEGAELKAECSTEWITDLKVTESIVSFTVLPNSAEEERETTINLSYPGAESKTLKVVQKGMGNMFNLQAAAKDESTIVATIKPDDNTMPYIVMIIPQTEADAYGNDEEMFNDDMTYLKYQAGKLQITLERIIEINQRLGEVNLEFSGLEAMTGYCIYCYGLSNAGERLTPITKVSVTTAAPAGLDCDFDISYDVNGIEVTMNVTPSNNEARYYFNMLQAELSDEEVMEKVMDYLGQIVYLYEQNGYTREQAIEAITFTGPQSYTFNVLEENTEYKGFAFAMSPSAVTGPITTKNVKTGTVAMSDNIIDIEVYDLQPRQVSVRCTPSNNDPYVVSYAPFDYYGNLTDDEVLPYLAEYFKSGQVQSVTGIYENDLTQLTPNTKYEMLVVGVNGFSPSTKLFRKTFTTPKEEQVDLNLTVEASKYFSASDAAKIYPQEFGPYTQYAILPVRVMADGGAQVYYNIYQGDYCDEASASDDVIIQNLIGGYTDLRTDFFVDFDTDVTLLATARDSKGNFCKCFRQHLMLTRDGVSPIEEYDFPGIEQSSSAAKAPSAATKAKTLSRHAATMQAIPCQSALKKAAPSRSAVVDTQRDAYKGPFVKDIMRRRLPDATR